jgi:hypothetical protein
MRDFGKVGMQNYDIRGLQPLPWNLSRIAEATVDQLKRWRQVLLWRDGLADHWLVKWLTLASDTSVPSQLLYL